MTGEATTGSSSSRISSSTVGVGGGNGGMYPVLVGVRMPSAGETDRAGERAGEARPGERAWGDMRPAFIRPADMVRLGGLGRLGERARLGGPGDKTRLGDRFAPSGGDRTRLGEGMLDTRPGESTRLGDGMLLAGPGDRTRLGEGIFVGDADRLQVPRLGGRCSSAFLRTEGLRLGPRGDIVLVRESSVSVLLRFDAAVWNTRGSSTLLGFDGEGESTLDSLPAMD